MDDRSQKAAFERFAGLTEKARGKRSLGFAETRELARLYRTFSAQLAALRSVGRDRERIVHLNRLCLRAFGFLYGASAPPRRRGRWRPLREICAVWQRTWKYQLLSTLLLTAAAIVGYQVVQQDPSAVSALISADLYDAAALEELYQSPQARADFLARDETSAARNSIFGAALFAHNTRVGLLSYGTGILGGLPTLLLLLHNGLSLGGFASIFLGDSAVLFWAWVLPHGIPECSAIILCSGGGLYVGHAVLAPGRVGRGPAVRRAALESLYLFFCGLLLFGIAAYIESFVRESALSTTVRFMVAAGDAVMLGLIMSALSCAGRGARGELRYPPGERADNDPGGAHSLGWAPGREFAHRGGRCAAGPGRAPRPDPAGPVA